MTVTWSDERIREFVKNTLGCGCPEKVFEKIDISKHLIEGQATEATRIVIGDTLLIYVIHPEAVGKLIDSVELIGFAGKADRDTNNYNRFRLVISSARGVKQKDVVSESVSKTFDKDEKMHIHFVNEKLVEGL